MYHVIYWTPGNSPNFKEFETEDALVACLRDLYRQAVSNPLMARLMVRVYANQVHVGRHPRVLVMGDGREIRLSAADAPGEAAQDDDFILSARDRR